MKLFGYFLIFTVCLAVGTLSFAISDYPNQRQLIQYSIDQGMRGDFFEDDEWKGAYGEAGGLSNPKISEVMKSGKATNH